MTSDSQTTSVLFRAMQHRADAIAESAEVSAHKFRAELLAGPRYAYPPTLVAPNRVEAEFVRSVEPRPVVVAIELREGALTIQCVCGRPCSHAMMVVVDLAYCPLLRASIDSEIDETIHRAVTEARRAFANRGRARREVLSWLDATRAEPYEPVWIDLTFPARSYAHARWGGTPRSATAFSAELVVTRPQNNHRLVSKDELPLCRFDPRVHTLLEQLDPSPSGRKSFHLDGRCGGAVLEELVALGATLDRRKLELSSDRATVHVRFDDALGAGGSVTTRITARFAVGDRVLGEELRWFDGIGPMVLDAASATLYRIDASTPRPLIERAADRRALSLPAGVDRSEAYRSLRTVARASAVVLPAPESVGLPSRETPSFALVLDGTTLHLHATLFARYPSGGVLLSGEREQDADTWRDLDVEQRVLQVLSAAEMLGAAPWAMSDDRAARFWFELLPKVEGLGVRVEVPAAMGSARIERTLRARTRVAFEEDWFSVQSSAVVDGEVALDFAVLRDAVLQRRTWVALSDGALAKITESVRDEVEELLALLGADGATGAAKVSRFSLGAIERLASREGVTLDAEAIAVRERWRATTIAVEPAVSRELRAELRPYQKQGLAWLQFLDTLKAGGVLADDMGLGKTLMTLAWLLSRKEREGAKPSLVIAPASVLGNWQREAERFAPTLKVAVLHGPSRHAVLEAIAGGDRSWDLCVTSYGLLRADIEALAGISWRATIFDEAQFVKNADSVSADSARRLRADTRLALTGTPVENHLGELWSIVDLVLPGMLGAQRSFDERYGRPVAAGDLAQAERLRALLRPFMLRRTKREVLSDLPEKEEIDLLVSMTPKQRALYNKVAALVRKDVEDAVREKGIERSAMNVLTALLRLRQLACDPRLISERTSAKESGKRAAWLDLFEKLREEGRRALVFSQFVSLLELVRKDLDREGIAYEYLDGTTVDRAERVRRFQEGDAMLFLISLKAGGTGLNLTAADTVIHLDPWWNPAVEEQATDRAHRMGQTRKVTVLRLIAEGTVEEKIQRLKERKREVANAVVRESEGAMKGLSEEDIALLLSESEGDAREESASEDERAAVERVQRKRGR